MLMAAGVTAAVVVGAFVFWGPSGTFNWQFSSPIQFYHEKFECFFLNRQFTTATKTWSNCWATQFRTNVFSEHIIASTVRLSTIYCLAPAARCIG